MELPPNAQVSQLLWLIPFFPLLGFIVNGLLSLGSAGSKLGASRAFAATVAVLMPALSFAVTVAAALQLACIPPLVVAPDGVGLPAPSLRQPLWEWLGAGSFHLPLGLLFDNLTSMMLLFITGIGALIHLYSVGYMGGDRGFIRFMAYLNLFMFSMIVLVLGDSLPATFIGWEGVGLCSYLLIGFWHQDHANNDAARKAFVVNRIGDLGFLLGAFFLYAAMGANGSLLYVDIAGWFQAHGPTLKGGGMIVAAAALIFVGCTGKSAQIPLLTWLPDAMAGPTPVSALIHAATMVTSGVYLLARLSDVFVLAPQVMAAITVIGCATAVFGAVAGLVQQDIKKVLAYSTVSQLGFMFMAAGVGAFDVALYHVFTHAFFKATLFLGAGSIIHSLHHEQDLRRMGGLTKLMPLTYASMWFGWFAIIGLPGGSGFMSKDLILEHLFASPGLGQVVGIIAVAAALLTAVYMTRLMYFAFWTPSRLPAGIRDHVHEAPFTMTLPVVILGAGSLFAGLFWVGLLEVDGKPRMNGFQRYLEPVVGYAQKAFTEVSAVHSTSALPGMEAEHTNPWITAIIGTAAALVGLLLARSAFRQGPAGGAEQAGTPLRGFAASWTFAFDRLYEVLVVKPVRALSAVIAFIDQVVLGGVANGFADISRTLGDFYLSYQRPRLRSSLAISVVGVLVIVIVLLWDLW